MTRQSNSLPAGSRKGHSGLTRRSVLAGGAAAGSLLAAGSIPAMALVPGKPSGLTGAVAGGGVSRKFLREPTLAKFLCKQVHEPMAHKLDEIIADPAIDGEGTALALMEARCPGCGQRVHPATRSPGEVVTQWQWVDTSREMSA